MIGSMTTTGVKEVGGVDGGGGHLGSVAYGSMVADVPSAPRPSVPRIEKVSVFGRRMSRDRCGVWSGRRMFRSKRGDTAGDGEMQASIVSICV